jgi:hypothetical protein
VSEEISIKQMVKKENGSHLFLVRLCYQNYFDCVLLVRVEIPSL